MSPSERKTEEGRYAAKLLFQLRVVSGGRSNRRRTCEERIIVLTASTASEALKRAKRRGKSEEVSWDDAGKRVHMEFVGVRELIDLGVESEPDEVWWEFIKITTPMERRAVLIPDEKQLTAFRWPKRQSRRSF